MWGVTSLALVVGSSIGLQHVIIPRWGTVRLTASYNAFTELHLIAGLSTIGWWLTMGDRSDSRSCHWDKLGRGLCVDNITFFLRGYISLSSQIFSSAAWTTWFWTPTKRMFPLSVVAYNFMQTLMELYRCWFTVKINNHRWLAQGMRRGLEWGWKSTRISNIPSQMCQMVKSVQVSNMKIKVVCRGVSDAQVKWVLSSTLWGVQSEDVWVRVAWRYGAEDSLGQVSYWWGGTEATWLLTTRCVVEAGGWSLLGPVMNKWMTNLAWSAVREEVLNVLSSQHSE